MKLITTNATTAAAFSIVAAITTAAMILPADAKSPCQGLSETQCQANPICTWRQAIVQGEISPVSKKPYKVSRKAHCRKRRAKSATK